MLLTIPSLLNAAQVDKIHEILQGASFVDGRLSAGFAAARVKHNLELQADEQRMRRLIRVIMASLGHNESFRFGALPHRVADPIIARYEPGMTYGDHVDDPIMGSTGPRFRTDVSMTIFLNSPESYEGGELVVRTPFGDQQVKLPAGDAVGGVHDHPVRAEGGDVDEPVQVLDEGRVEIDALGAGDGAPPAVALRNIWYPVTPATFFQVSLIWLLLTPVALTTADLAMGTPALMALNKVAKPAATRRAFRPFARFQ